MILPFGPGLSRDSPLYNWKTPADEREFRSLSLLHSVQIFLSLSRILQLLPCEKERAMLSLHSLPSLSVSPPLQKLRSTPQSPTRLPHFLVTHTHPLSLRRPFHLLPPPKSSPSDPNVPIPGENIKSFEQEKALQSQQPQQKDDAPTTNTTTKQLQLFNNNPQLKLAGIFGLWYMQNIIFNIYNKKALNLFPYPWLLASFQLAVGSLWMTSLWLLNLQPFPKVSKPFFIALLLPALFHTIGHISACVSFSKVAVSFTHVIKASEPVFSVAFSSLFFAHHYPFPVYLSLLPIVLGCALAAVTELSFNAAGLAGALISNVGFVLRNIYSKKSLQDFSHVNGLNLYGWISIVSLAYLFPVAVVVEGGRWAEGWRQAVAASGGEPWRFYWWVALSGVFYHLYNQSSYQALDEISPLTFSVGNTMKRVVVIAASLVVFRNPIRPLNALGSAMAVFGTFLYSQATATAKKEQPEKTS